MPKILDPTRRADVINLFDADMRRRVIGQGDAIDSLTSVYQKCMAGLTDQGRPLGSILFLGPTGVGKTRAVEAMAEVLYKDPRACLKIDCAEFQHSHEIAKLIGSPPGYLGHRETQPVLTQEAVNQWHTATHQISLVLFDEIEKASDALWRLLLGIMDKAVLTLGDNRRVDFSRALIIMTSNLGAHDMQTALTGGMGFTPGVVAVDDKLMSKQSEIATGAARRKFDPEFMNRIGHTVVFKSLSESDMRQILEIELGYVQQRIMAIPALNASFVFHASDRFKDFLIHEGYEPKYGARHIKRAIEKHLVEPLSNLMLTQQVCFGDCVNIEMLSDQVKFVLDDRSIILNRADANGWPVKGGGLL